MSKIMPTHLSLFSGIGGIDLAAHWAGWETVAFCEAETFCQRVLARHWPGVPIFPDVRELNAATLRSVGVHQVDLISGGYPCQPFSLAGQRRGDQDPRHLWPHFRRLIGELRPRWVMGENVPGHLSLGLDDVILDLERLDYEPRVFVFPAESVGAAHRRERLFVLAHARSHRLQAKFESEEVGGTPSREGIRGDSTSGEPDRHGHERSQVLGIPEPSMGRDADGLPAGLDRPRHPRIAHPGADQFPGEPARLCGRGVKDRTKRLKALGNAVDPYQVFPLLQAISNH